jgi:transcriptional regulator with XRE-family HTH domain
MPLVTPKRPIGHVLTEARQKLGMSQAQFGPALGSSHRTATRWDAGQSLPAPTELRRLAKLLLPLDTALAAEAAAHMGDTLESLGLVAPKPPPPPVAPPTPPQDLADIVVCAAAEASDVSPRAMRPLLHVAFRRAREVGLTVEQVERALAPLEAKAPAPARSGAPAPAQGAVPAPSKRPASSRKPRE